MWDLKLAQRLHHRLHPVLVGGDGEHAKCFPSKLPLVLSRGMRRQVRAHFFFEAGLSKGIRPHHRHGAAIDLDHEGMAGTVRELESEDEVGDETDLVHDSLVRKLHAQRQRIAGGASLVARSAPSP